MVEDADVSRRFLMCPLCPLTGWIIFLREEQSSLHRHKVGGGAGTRKTVTGAESRLHRREVGGGAGTRKTFTGAESRRHRPKVGGGAGTRKTVTGAESRRHRREVGGGGNSSPFKKLGCAHLPCPSPSFLRGMRQPESPTEGDMPTLFSLKTTTSGPSLRSARESVQRESPRRRRR